LSATARRHLPVTLILLVGAVFSVLVLVSRIGAFHMPGNHEGYSPEQPIEFSHRLHAGELLIDCLYCHSGAEQSRHAGFPSGDVCMNCHSFITAPLVSIRAEGELAAEEGRKANLIISPEIQKIYNQFGLNDEMQPDEAKPLQPVEWIKIHNLPDFVYFDHRSHVGAGVACQQCHGPVETMERMRQVENLTMGWCVNCHREVNEIGVNSQPVHASLDCVTCHY